MTSQMLASFAAGALSLILAYSPFLSDRYNKLTVRQKAGIYAGLIVGAGVGAYLLSCSFTPPVVVFVPLECSQTGFFGLLQSVFGALTGGAATYIGLVRPFTRQTKIAPLPAKK